MEDRALNTMKEFYKKYEREKFDAPSMDWIKDFVQRYSLEKRRETPLEKERMENATVGNIQAWFQQISKEIDLSKF